MKPLPRRTILSFPLALFVRGCAQAAQVGPTDELSNSRVDAIVAFGQGIANEIHYALRQPRRFSWSFAPVIRVPTASASGMSVTGAAGPALLVVLKSETRERPAVTASLFQIERALPDRSTAPAESVAMRPCIGEGWITAFFVEGLGPSPSGPVVLEYSAGGVKYRLRIDPKLHTVRATPALRLARGDVDVDSTLPERRVVSIEVSNTFKPVLPVLIWRDPRRWHAAGGTARGGDYGIIMNGDRDQRPEEWRLYMLEAPPPC